MTTIKLKDLYNKTAEVLERDGWTQGDYHCGGKHCVVGAFSVAATEMCGNDGSQDDVLYGDQMDNMLLPMVRAIGGRGVIGWNDTAGRTQDDVIAKLREVAAVLETDEVQL